MNAISKPDLYTKVVLTVIAACLVWLCVNNMTILPQAMAQGAGTVSSVQIIGIDPKIRGVLPVGIAETKDPLPIKTAGPLDVNVVGIAKGKKWDAVKVENAAAPAKP